jgi:hypothetical protein
MYQRLLFVEYHATMESCSDQFHAIFQTSRELVLVVLTVSTFCACHVLSSDRSDRLASPLEKNQELRIKNYHYRHRHYIVLHHQPLCVV